jgi:hypothetical protein
MGKAAKGIQDYYAAQSVITSLGKHSDLTRELPDSVEAIVRIIQGLVIYDVVAKDFYGYDVPDNRKSEIHLRPIEELLDTIFQLKNAPLAEPRQNAERLVGRCSHYARLFVAFLRAKGIPARARSGFAAYLNPGSFEDHTVCEYWSDAKSRWVLADAQIDSVWKENLHFAQDSLDLSRDQFIVATDAWDRCRKNQADPAKFGISFNDLHGLWFVASSVIHDIADLNKKELLQWDTWGAMPKPNHELDKGELAYFDALAELTAEPDTNFDAIRDKYTNDERLRVPQTVFNALLDKSEAVKV